MIVTDPGNLRWAGGGVYRGESLPGLEGPEVDQVNPAEPTPRPLEVLAQSPVSCGAVPSYSDVTYYVAASGAGVFDSGTEDWICALPMRRNARPPASASPRCAERSRPPPRTSSSRSPPGLRAEAIPRMS